MQIDLAALPDDPAILRQMLRDVVGAADTTAQAHAQLQAENDKLRLLIQRLLRQQFGRRSEQLAPDQLQLALEDIEQAIGAGEAAQEAAAPGDQKQHRARPARRNQGALPAHLPRIEVLIDVGDKSCPCCGGNLHRIGEDISEMLDLVPAQLRVKVIRRPRYGCRDCAEAVVQAPAPERPIDGGMATEALIAHVLVSKFADHLPLYRQAQILARQGVNLDRSTLGNWVGRACWWLTPLYELTLCTALASNLVFADDTTLPVLEPGRGRTRTGRLWCYAVDDRPWQGPRPPAAAYRYSTDRKGEHPAAHLAGFSGTLQVDGYGGFKSLVERRPDGALRLAFCWAHARRKFFDVHAATKSPLAGEALARIGTLYEVEAAIRGHPAEHRRCIRQGRSRPIVEAFHAWLTEQLRRLPGASALAEAIRYTLNHWPGFLLFLDDGRLEIDTNTVERAMRPVALGRKNALFAGSDAAAQHWAIALTLVQSAKLNGIDPMAYITDVLTRIVSRQTKTQQLHQLLPWNWKLAIHQPLPAAA